MAKRKRGVTDYVRRRKGTSSYWFRFRYPKDLGLRPVEHSLYTSDYQEAKRIAAGLAADCLDFVAVMRALRDSREERRPYATKQRKWEEGEHDDQVLPDGTIGRVIATQARAVLLRPGCDPEVVDNVEWVDSPTAWPRATDQWLKSMGLMTGARRSGFAYESPEAEAPKPVAEAADELAAHVETWLSEGHKTRAIRNEATRVLAIWREISGGKALKDCGRSDGIKLREHLFAIGQKSQTAQKNCGHLSAALNYAAREHDYKGPNPFKALVTADIKKKKGDRVRGRPFSEEDMAKVRAALPSWHPEARLLWVLCATTGMRRGEAFLIEREDRLSPDLRCITLVPTNEDDSIKTDESERMIPIPADALPYLPEKITGRLFKTGANKVGEKVNAYLRGLGVAGPGKTLKSTRHRAAVRLKHARGPNGELSPPDLRRQILGHEFADVHDDVYARGYPLDMLRPWIDKIGLGPTDRSA